MASDFGTCKNCGVVRRGHTCPYQKRKEQPTDRQSDRFRKTKAWTDKSIEIRQRDRYLCQVCFRELYNTISAITFKGVDVHHITPIAEDYSKRLDNDNLISLCRYHHKMADDGLIPREVLYGIVKAHRDDG